MHLKQGVVFYILILTQAGSLSMIENGDVKKATQVMLDPLLSADPSADSVLVRRFCVTFSSVSGTASSINPLFLIARSLAGALLTSHSISPSVVAAIHSSTGIVP